MKEPILQKPISSRQATRILAPFLLAAVLAGCASSKPHYANPDLSNRYEASGRSALVIDAAFLQDVAGDVDVVDVPRSLVYARLVTDSARTQLRRKGYVVDDAAPVSVGHTLARDIHYRVLRTEEERALDPATLTVALPPYYADSTESIGGFASFDPDVLRGVREAAAPAKDALPSAEDGLALLLALQGRHVPAKKQFGQALKTGLLSLGTYYEHEQTYLQGRLYVVDTVTGEILWADAETDAGDFKIDENDVAGVLARLIEKLPDAGSPVRQ